VAIGATWQVNPNCFISLASDPVKTPKEMIGKKVGVPSDSVEIVQGFLKANGVSPSAVTIVPVQFDPTPLADKEVEVYFGIITSEPIQLQLKGVKTYSMLLADFGEPELTEIYITTTSALNDPKSGPTSRRSSRERSEDGKTSSPTRAQPSTWPSTCTASRCTWTPRSRHWKQWPRPRSR
jgi:hypothetical protein